MIVDAEEIEITLTEPARKVYELIERILEMNDRALRIIEAMSKAPVIARTAPNNRRE